MSDGREGGPIGREAQLETLRSMLPAVGDGPRCVLFDGDPGSGRALLVSQLADSADAQFVLRWRFPEGEDGVGTLLRIHAGAVAALTRRTSGALRVLEHLRDADIERPERVRAWIDGVLANLGDARQDEQGRIEVRLPQDNPYWGHYHLALEAAAAGPTVIELQHVNAVTSPAFWVWLRRLFAEVQARSLPVLWILSTVDSPYGEQPGDPLPQPTNLLFEVFESMAPTRLEMPPLTAEQVDAALRQRYQPHGFPDGLARQLHFLGGSQPGPLGDLLDLLESEEIVVWDEERGFHLDRELDQLTAQALVPFPFAEGREPPAVEGIADAAEAARLARAVLHAGAVEGPRFTASLIAATLGLERDVVDDLLDEMSEIVSEEQFVDPLQSWTYRFKRPLFRAHFQAPAADRNEALSLTKMARVLVEGFVPASPVYVAVAARLFSDAGQKRQARNLLALAMGSDRLDLSRYAQELIERTDADGVPANLLRLIHAEPAERAANGARPEAAAEMIDRLARWAEHSDDVGLGAFAELLRSRVAMRGNDTDAAVAHAEKALAGFHAAGEAVREAETLNQLAILTLRKRDARGVQEYLDRAAKASTIPPVKAHTVFVRGLLRRGEGKLSAAVDAFAEAGRLATEAGNPLLALEARLNQGEVSIVQGQARAAREPLRAALNAARAMRAKALERSASTLLAQSEAATGNPGEAYDLARDALAIAEELGIEGARAADLYHCGVFAVAAGKGEQAIEHLREAAAAVGPQDGPLTKEVRFHLGQLLMVSGELDEARASLEQSRALAQQLGDAPRAARARQALGMVAEKADDRAGAIEHYRAAMEEMGAPALQREREAIKNRLAQLAGEN